MDRTVAGMVPGAITDTGVYLKYVRTGPDTWQLKGLIYFKDDAKPKPNILMIGAVDVTGTMTAPGEIDWAMTQSGYLGSQDKDLDGLPDVGEKPICPPWDAIYTLKSL
jgi:hypothetical protein